MKKFIVLLFISCPAMASFSGYTYQRTITISSTNVSNVLGTLSNFPVLVSTNDVSLSTTTGSGGRLNSSGMDLIFSTMSDCSFKLFWDTETVQNVGISTFNAWVNLPVLTTATLTAATFYMCYGQSGITTYQGISTNTWDSNFKGVWHLPGVGGLGLGDSTSNSLTMTNNSTVTSVAGQVDGAGNFVKASTQYLSNGNAAATAVPITLEAWVKLADTSFGAGEERVIVSIDKTTGVEEFWTGFFNSGGNKIRVVEQGSGLALEQDFGTTFDTNWHHVVGVFSTISALALYLDGALQTTSPLGTAIAPLGLNGTDIGLITLNTSTLYGPQQGIEDEVRISNSARNSDWIKTEYNNQNSPSTFSSIGPEQQSASIVSNQVMVAIRGGKVGIRGGKASIFVSAAVVTPPSGTTGQCMGLLCGITYPN